MYFCILTLKEVIIMAVATGKHADHRTKEQMANYLAQTKRPKGAQDTTYVTTGPATGKTDERVRPQTQRPVKD